MEADYTTILGFFEGLRPVSLLSVSDWSDQYRRLSPKAAAEPGPYRTDRAPFLREIMDMLGSNNSVEDVIVMKGAQLGLTEAGNNWVGYTIHNDPAPMLMVMPTAETMKRNSEIRIAPMIEATPVLKDKVKEARSRDSGNKQLQKDFPGGVLIMTGANSASGLRSMPVRKLFLDEIDGYPADLDEEGSPLDLAEARTRTFARRKIYKISTPTIQGASAIETEFNTTDQRYFYVPCPECGDYQTLNWEQIKYDKTLPKAKQPATARYECIHCEAQLEERQKAIMLKHGEWRATKPENASPIRVGYHINTLYSPWYKWAEIVGLWIKAQGKQAKLKAFVNTILGEVWVTEGEAPEWEPLYSRREAYDGTVQVPNSVGVITAGADIQKDRIEVEVVGWAQGNESWSLGYFIIGGDPSGPAVWLELAELLNRPFERADGTLLLIRCMAIDTGFLAQQVYKFAKGYPADRVVPTKGQGEQQVPIAAPQAVQKRTNGKRTGTARLVNIGVSILKAELYGWLKLRYSEDFGIPPGYCHFPTLYDEHYFKMLTAEKRVYVANKKGFGKFEWVKHFERNEALDCRVYARAAALVIGIENMKPAAWARLAPQAVPVIDPAEEIAVESPQVAKNEPLPKPDKAAPAKKRGAKRESIWNSR